jgi:acetylornithine/succinyldiaminopimelate/putrescine aminotransferase
MQKGVTPDILTSAKGIGGGFPIGCFITTNEIASVMVPGTHGTTYGGNPLGAAMAETVLDIVKKHNVFNDVRGEGLWLGCELTAKYDNKAGDFMKAGHRNNVVFLTAGNNNILRFAPALNITDAEIDEGLLRVERAVVEMVNK